MTTALTKTDTPAPTPIDDSTMEYLRADGIIDAINASLPAGSPLLQPIPRSAVFYARDRRVVQDALSIAFQCIGGVPALIQFSQTHPKEFWNMWSRMMPAENTNQAGGTNIIFQSAIPQSPLDMVSIRPDGEVYTQTIPVDDKDLPE